jgi:hypothetical protein
MSVRVPQAITCEGATSYYVWGAHQLLSVRVPLNMSVGVPLNMSVRVPLNMSVRVPLNMSVGVPLNMSVRVPPAITCGGAAS